MEALFTVNEFVRKIERIYFQIRKRYILIKNMIINTTEYFMVNDSNFLINVYYIINYTKVNHIKNTSFNFITYAITKNREHKKAVSPDRNFATLSLLAGTIIAVALFYCNT